MMSARDLRRGYEYGSASGALGLAGAVEEAYQSAAFCFQDPVSVVVVVASDAEFDVETAALVPRPFDSNLIEVFLFASSVSLRGGLDAGRDRSRYGRHVAHR